MRFRTNTLISLSALAVLASFAGSARAETIVRVTNEAELRSAFNNAAAGTTIQVADGTYVLRGILQTGAAGTSSAPIKVIAENRRRPIIETNGMEEAFRITRGYWWIEGLTIRATVNSNYCIKLEGDGHHARIRYNTLEIRPGSEAGIKGAGGATYPWPDYAVIDRNDIYMTAPTTYGLAEGIDAVAVQGWVIKDNTVHDIKTAAGGVAYGIMTKGNCIDTIIERNTVWNSFIGISLGGGGTGSQWMRNNSTTYESRNGIIRSNVVKDSVDVAMYIYNANGTKIYNNTTYNSYTSCGVGCSSIDVRMSGSTADVQNNILDKRVNNRDGGTHTANNNLTLPTPTYTGWFVSASSRNFRLSSAATLARNRGVVLREVTTDVNRYARPIGGAPDIGATEQ